MKRILIVGAVALLPAFAHAQVLVDMTRITCGEYVSLPPEQSRLFSAWMSGWFNQKTGYAWVDLNAYERNIANVKQYCATAPRDMVMSALERATKR
ncbi:MAG: HdeA/HdeB family chaperone [Pseudorhodoplanes sp.]